jgi:DNA-directed RNA polymerase subunit F
LPGRIIEKRDITVSETREMLKKLESELDQFQRRTLDYADKFSKIDAGKAAELVEELVSRFSLERERAIQLVNCMPETIEEIRVFFVGGKWRLMTPSQLEEILQTLKKYRNTTSP